MKPLNLILCLAGVIPCWAEDNTLSDIPVSIGEKLHISLPFTSENEALKMHLNQGMQACLFDYREKAVYHFNQAIKQDPECVMAHVCHMLLHSSRSPEYRDSLQATNQLLEEAMLTPVEEWYVSTFLQHITGDIQGAAQAFRKRASVYRRDLTAALWDIQLNLYEEGQGSEVLARADALVERYPDNALVLYCRALLDEKSAIPSEKSLQCAQKAVEIMPGSPAAQQLLGRYLHRSGRLSEAIPHISEALRLYKEDLSHIHLSHAAGYRTNQLTEATAFWEAGRKADALKRSLALIREIPENIAGEGDILIHWEARTLPLRLLVMQPVAPTGAAINAAAKASNAPHDTPLALVQNCLVAAIQARALADAGRPIIAQQTLTKSEKILSELCKEGDNMIRQGGMTHTCYSRALSACMGATIRARIALYKDSADIWQPHLDTILKETQPRFLPPVLPRFPRS